MRISDWSSDVCSSDLHRTNPQVGLALPGRRPTSEVGLPALEAARQRAGAALRSEGGVDLPDPLGRCGPSEEAHKAGCDPVRSEEHTSELQSLMRISYAVFCLKKKKNQQQTPHTIP